MNIRLNSRVSPSGAGLLAALIALVFSAGLALWAPAASGRLDVGSPGDDRYISSFFRAEANSVETFRWMSDHATIRIPVDRPGTYRLDLDLAAVDPGERTLRLACGESASEVRLNERSGNFTASLDCSTADGTIPLTLDVPVVYLPPGGRALGVSVRDLTVTPLDGADRLLHRARMGLTVVSSLLGVGLAIAALSSRRPVWSAGLGIVAATWLLVAIWNPDVVLAATTGPGGLLALAGGLTGWLLATRQRGAAIVSAALAPLIMAVLPPRPLVRVLEGTWTAPDDAAVRLLPWLAVLAIVGAALIGGPRARWLAATGVVAGAGSLFLPVFVAVISARWSHQISVPDWTDVASSGGAIYVVVAFVVAAVAGVVALARADRLPVLAMLVAGIGVIGLLAWRVEIMRLNGDEPHYFVTARSIGEDGDLELLDNYLEPIYRESTYSPVGNLAVTRDNDANRYAAHAPVTGDEAWYLLPDVPGWASNQHQAGPIPASGLPPLLSGPDGAISRPPALQPDNRHVILLDAPCTVERLMVTTVDGSEPVIGVQVLDAAGTVIWERGGLATGEVSIPPDSGLCRQAGPWAVVVESGGAPVLAQAVETFHGLHLVGSDVARSWLFAGLPQDRYGSRSARARLLLHNPTETTVLASVRLISPSDLTGFEIAIGLEPGKTVWEPVPVTGAAAIRVDIVEEAGVSARLIGSLEPARFDIPATEPVTAWTLTVPPASDQDGGVWLSVVNWEITAGEILVLDGGLARRIDLCGLCGDTLLLPGGEDAREVQVRGVDGSRFWPAAVEYEERTGSLHFDLGLPLLAAPLARSDAAWPTFLIPALAAVLFAPGMLLLLESLGIEQRVAAGAAVIVTMLAPVSTYAVRLYTEVLASVLLVWALYCWHRARERIAWHAPVILVTLALPLLHGRLTPLAAVLGSLVAVDLLHRTTDASLRSLLTARNTVVVAAALAGVTVLLVISSRFAIALTSRNIEHFFHLGWVLPNSAGMLLDRGSGVLPFAPWVLLGLAVPLPLHRLQRAGLLLVLVAYGVLLLRAGGWQTWGSPVRYLLPVVPLVALLAVPGALRLWRQGVAGRMIVSLALLWSVLATMLLHWLPLSGYVLIVPGGGRYLIDEALQGVLGFSPFRIFPTILALPGPDWGRPIGLVIVFALAATAIWIARPLVFPGDRDQRPAHPASQLEVPGSD